MSALICTGGLGEFPFFEIDVICTDEGCCREEEEEQEMGASTKKKIRDRERPRLSDLV